MNNTKIARLRILNEKGLHARAAAKFVDRVSAVGGTFGLLTGFSLISGVEILFFLAKFFISIISRKMKIHGFLQKNVGKATISEAQK